MGTQVTHHHALGFVFPDPVRQGDGDFFHKQQLLRSTLDRRISCSLASISALLLPSVSRRIPRAANTSFNSGTIKPAISAAFASEMRCCRHNATAPSSRSVG